MTMTDAVAGELPLPGPLTIRTISAVREMLQASLASHQSIILNIPADAEADISFVQLVLAAQASAKAAGKRIGLKAPPSGALLDVLTRGGFLEAPDAALWSEGTSGQ